MAKWITFTEVPTSKKTKTFEINAKEGGYKLGVVKWYASWRKYSFFPEPNTLFESKCLQDITDFMNGLMEERKSPSLTEIILGA